MLASSAAKWLPKDFVETTQTGGAFTIVAYVVMTLVFFCEFGSFLSSSYSTTMSLDKKAGTKMQINFDVDLYDIECRNLKVIVFAQQSKERVTSDSQDFWLRSIDNKGRTFGMAIKPADSSDEEIKNELDHEQVMKKLLKEAGKSELDSDWSTSHDGFNHKSFDDVIAAHDYTFINFFAGWCSHCRQFSPAWAQLAEKIHGDGADKPAQMFKDRDGADRGVRFIKMNCVDFKDLCNAKGIDAYPMLRLYKGDGTFSLFEGKRDEAEIIRWLERTIKMKSYGWAENHETFERGCNAKGRIVVDRVPGHLELMAGGGDQNLNAKLTNVSHLVKHLSFSDPDNGRYHKRSWQGIPADVLTHESPLDGQAFVTNSYHQTYIHDMKVVSTISSRDQVIYQFLHQKRLSTVPNDDLPQAQFHYDFEPFSIWVKRDEKRWYDFLTSLLALLGGAFVMMRLMTRVSLTMVMQLRHLVPKPRGGSRSGSMPIGHFD